MIIWLTFFVGAIAVAGAGMRLAKDGNTLAEGSGLGGMWIGAILVAAMTSLPELITGINAVASGHPSLAGGDVFGACMANMMILAVADLATRGPRILTRVTVNQALVGTLAISMCVVALLGIVTELPHGLVLGWATLVIGFLYVAGMRLLHLNREAPPFRTEAEVDEMRPKRAEMRRAIVGFVLAAIVVLIAAPAVVASAATLSERLEISEGFVGTVFLAMVTTLPEAAVTFGSIRTGAYSLAVGNLFGSNCFNIAALVPFDVAYGRGSIIAAFEPSLTVAALFAVLLMALAILEILNKSERRIWLLEPGPAFMLVTYAVGLVAVYRMGG